MTDEEKKIKLATIFGLLIWRESKFEIEDDELGDSFGDACDRLWLDRLAEELIKGKKD